jgi:hypothetical protein
MARDDLVRSFVVRTNWHQIEASLLSRSSPAFSAATRLLRSNMSLNRSDSSDDDKLSVIERGSS